MIRFSLAIAHTPWMPERVASYERLCESLSLGDFAPFKCFDEKALNHVWSAQMWEWSATQDADWCVFLQDDAVVAPDFFTRLSDIIVADGPGDVIGLQVAHPAAIPLALEGCAGFTTADGIVGVGYAVKRTTLEIFLKWRALLAPEALEAITEDSLLGLFCATRGLRVYHPIPTIVDHDTSLPSTFGNDGHTNRRSRVRWDTELTEAAPAGSSARVAHLGCFYQATPHLAKQWDPSVSATQFKALLADNGHREAKRLNFARRARGIECAAKVFVATPMMGGVVHATYAATINALMRDEAIDVESGLEIADVQQWQGDVVRTRSRFVSWFLNQTDATHLLFLDSDIDCPPSALRGMLAANKPFVGCPYPRRDGVNYKRVRENPEMPAEAVAYFYVMRALDDQIIVKPDGCAEVKYLPLGCALLRREEVQKLYDQHAFALGFDDVGHGSSVALFQLVLDDRALLSEDYSFCHRWRAAGGKVWMYLGEGSPVNHSGQHRYVGNVEAFGLRRT